VAGELPSGHVNHALETIYEDGALRLAKPLPLPSHARVTVTAQTMDDEGERLAGLKLSEAALAKTLGHPANDVFNALLKK
jgi:hypothetical protein